MIRLITPPGMLLTTALLAIYCAYAFMIGLTEESLPLLAGGGMAVVATYGAAMVRPWSRFLVYALTLGFIAKLGSSIIDATRAGYFQFQFNSAAEILWSLTPSLLMTVLSCVCCGLVHRQFKKRQPLPATVMETGMAQPAPVTPSTDP